MSISQNFPSTRPSLNLNFARSQKLDPRITFTRSSTATYTGGDGLIKTAATDTPRFDFNATTGECLGLLIEENRTNLITYSHEINNTNFWFGSRTYISIDSTISPDGSQNADKLVEDVQTGPHHRYFALSVVNGTTYTLSAFYKAAERSVMSMQIGNQQTPFPDSGTYGARFNLLTGSIIFQGSNVERASIDLVGNGWYKCSITATAVDTAPVQIFIAFLINEGGNSSYTGDNTSGIYIWGAQLEVGAFPTSYIPTVASTVTRSADSASITGTNFSSWYNPSEGTVLCNASNISGTSSLNRLFYQFVNSSNVNADFIRQWIWSGNTNLLLNSVYTSNSGPIAAELSTTLTDEVKKTSLAYKINDFALSYRGSSPSTDTSGNLPSGINQLTIGNNIVGATPLSGYISQLSYYPVRLSNSQLQSLTK